MNFSLLLGAFSLAMVQVFWLQSALADDLMNGDKAVRNQAPDSKPNDRVQNEF